MADDKVGTMGRSVQFYDALSGDYDRFVNWQYRLEYEMPFIDHLLSSSGVQRVLDVACGTGMHALALVERGYQVKGVDISDGMIERARDNALAKGVDIPFSVAGFGNLARVVKGSFDGILCLGNSFPHILSKAELKAALNNFKSVLQPGGLVVIQNRNFDAVMRDRNRWMEPESHSENGREWVFIRFYDFNSDGRIIFNILTLFKDDEKGTWQQNVQSSQLWPWQRIELEKAFEQSGFTGIQAYGDMTGKPFDPETSGNLILTAVYP